MNSFVFVFLKILHDFCVPPIKPINCCDIIESRAIFEKLNIKYNNEIVARNRDWPSDPKIIKKVGRKIRKSDR